MSINWQPLWELIQQNQRFILTSHVRPDADAIGSELAMANLLENMGKEVRVINPSAAPNNLAFLDPRHRLLKAGEDIKKEAIVDTDVHMILDTSAWAQLTVMCDPIQASNAKKVVIDHHIGSDNLGAMEFKDTSAPATGTLVFDFARTHGLAINPETAMLLYAAIATDTGWFRFSSTSGETMRIIGELIDLGARPPLIYELLYEQRSLARLKLTARVLARVELACEGRLAYTTVEWNDFDETGATPVDTEDLVNECLKIAGTEGAFIAVEQQNRQIKASLRSRTGLNVAEIAQQFGGGGHRQASGVILPGPLRQATRRLLAAMTSALNSPS